MAFDKTVQHVVAELAGGAIRGDPLIQAGHLVHEIHQAEVKVILNQREGIDPNPFVGAPIHFF
jgi:hypothetical protein